MQIRPFTTMWAVALLCLVLGPASSNADEAAASIEYRFVARPAGLPGDLQPGTGTSLKFLSIKAIDGFTVDAGLWQPNAKQAAETTVIVMVSGSGGSYARAPNSVLGRFRGPCHQYPAA